MIKNNNSDFAVFDSKKTQKNDQLHSNHAADLHVCVCFIDSTITLLSSRKGYTGSEI